MMRLDMQVLEMQSKADK